MPTLPAVSREYLYLPGITAFDSLSPDHTTDPTTLPVQVALTTDNDPVEADWINAEWVDTTTARILTGPGGTITPAVGVYQIWLRVTGAVEQPERRVGTLRVI